MEVKKDEFANPSFFLPIENCGLTRKKEMKDDGDIDDSGLEWELECPIMLANVDVNVVARPNSYQSSFFCKACNENVYKVESQEALKYHVERRHCVTFTVKEKKADSPPQSRTKRGRVAYYEDEDEDPEAVAIRLAARMERQRKLLNNI